MSHSSTTKPPLGFQHSPAANAGLVCSSVSYSLHTNMIIIRTKNDVRFYFLLLKKSPKSPFKYMLVSLMENPEMAVAPEPNLQRSSSVEKLTEVYLRLHIPVAGNRFMLKAICGGRKVNLGLRWRADQESVFFAETSNPNWSFWDQLSVGRFCSRIMFSREERNLCRCKYLKRRSRPVTGWYVSPDELARSAAEV